MAHNTRTPRHTQPATLAPQTLWTLAIVCLTNEVLAGAAHFIYGANPLTALIIVINLVGAIYALRTLRNTDQGDN